MNPLRREIAVKMGRNLTEVTLNVAVGGSRAAGVSGSLLTGEERDYIVSCSLGEKYLAGARGQRSG